MILKIPIEHVERIADAPFVTAIHCNGIDLYPNDLRIVHQREGEYDFVLFGKQRFSRSAKRGDLAAVTIITINELAEKAIAELERYTAMLEDLIAEYAEE